MTIRETGDLARVVDVPRVECTDIGHRPVGPQKRVELPSSGLTCAKHLTPVVNAQAFTGEAPEGSQIGDPYRECVVRGRLGVGEGPRWVGIDDRPAPSE